MDLVVDNLHQKRDDIELQAMTEDTKDVEMDSSTNVGIHNEGFLPDEDQDNDISLSITYHNNRIRDRTASGSLYYPRSGDSQLLEHSVFFDLNEDETDHIKVAPKLLQLQFPCADEGHCDDVAEVIRRRLNSIDHKAKGPIDAFALIYQSGLARRLSWQAQVEEAVKDEPDEFWRQVAQKTQNMEINRTDAIFEVYTDLIVKKKLSCDKALLWVFSQSISEFSAELFVTRLLQRGANTSTTDKKLNTPLHYAAKKGWTSIAKKLMEHQSIPVAINSDGLMPLELAIRNDRNDCATFLVNSMEPVRVRNLFEGNEENCCRLSFHSLLDKPNMQSTVMAVLDTMLQPLEAEPDAYIVYYNILDGDQNGRPPSCPNFDASEKSCLHKIAKSNNKEVVYHKVVRLLLRRKWNEFARFRFMNQFAFYLLYTAIMTLALVLAARKSDPLDYSEAVDILRGICEAVMFLFVTYNVCREGYQLKKYMMSSSFRHKLHYFTDFFNYLDSGAIIFTFLIVPFRITSLPTQWIFASLGYLCQTLRGFEFAAVFRSTGAYVQILSRILIRDMIPFGAIFGLFLFAFTGAFYFALRGEEVPTSVNTTNCSSEIDEDYAPNVTTVELSSLDLFPYLTKEYYHVLFTNLRVMIESEGVIENYFGPNGYGWLSVIIYTVFLFLVITVLLNLLIAQMSDTYTNVQSDAQRSLFINRAWIVAKAEHNSLFISAFLDCRKRKYINCEIIENPHDLLEKWEAPPINQVTKELVKLHRLIKQREAANEQLHKDIQLMIQEKESAHEIFRASIMEAMNEQKQLIHKLISKQENESEA